MKLAVMQPYLFPYIGYFQLINAVDKFVILDDVHYIKKGWINRNRILVNNKEYLFTVPVKSISQNKLINELYLVEEERWKKDLVRTINFNYKNAPFFSDIILLISKIINSNEQNLSKYILNSLQLLNRYMKINTEVITSSSIYGNSWLKGQDRILDICKQENADIYLNAIGGSELYSREEFIRNGINLKFLKSLKIVYSQYETQFLPWLSIIDVMMFNPKEKIRAFLDQYELL